jgi:hypothetical protein
LRRAERVFANVALANASVHGNSLAADARHPVDAAAQLFLQPCAELLQYPIAAGVSERIVDALEEIDVARDQRERAAVTRGALSLRAESACCRSGGCATRVRSSVAESLRFSASVTRRMTLISRWLLRSAVAQITDPREKCVGTAP